MYGPAQHFSAIINLTLFFFSFFQVFSHGRKSSLEHHSVSHPAQTSSAADSVQAFVDSVKEAVSDSNFEPRSSAANAKQPHSLGELFDGFQDKVAHIQQQEQERMRVFEEIRLASVFARAFPSFSHVNWFLSCPLIRYSFCGEQGVD